MRNRLTANLAAPERLARFGPGLVAVIGAVPRFAGRS